MAFPEKIIFDLNKYKITICFKDNIEPIPVLFNKSSSRIFYFCLIALIVIEMKKKGSISYIDIKKGEIKKDLFRIDKNISDSFKSTEVKDLFGKIKKAWNNNLPNLLTGIHFEVEGRKSFNEDGTKFYNCDDNECDIWSSLFVHGGRVKSWFFKFAIDSPKVNLKLVDVEVVFNGRKDIDAWESFLNSIECGKQETTIKEKPPIEKSVTIETEIKNRDYSKAIFDSLPSLPEHKIVGREEDLKKITEKLEEIDCDSQTNRRNIFVIHGLPGVGKTTMSIVLSHHKKIQSIFNDGIIWTTIGNNQELLPLLKSLSINFKSINLSEASTIEDAENILRGHLRKGKFLIIVDDVWKIADARSFIKLSNYVSIVITTRIRRIPYSLNLSSDKIFKLDVLSEIDSLKLLSEIVPAIAEKHKNECVELVRALEGLPLAIRVAGHLLREQYDYGLSVSEFIKDLKEGKYLLESEPPGEMQIIASETSATIAVLLKRSTDYLTENAKLCFSLFAHLPSKPVQFKYNDLKDMYEEKLKIKNPDGIIKEFLNLGLIESFTNDGKSSIHSLLVLLAETFI